MTTPNNHFTSYNLRGAPTFSDAASTEDETNEGIPFSPRWADDAPRGGRQVLNRALKESAAVPLFLAQTFIQSLRDVGYDSTTSAICEPSTMASVRTRPKSASYIRQIGKKGALKDGHSCL